VAPPAFYPAISKIQTQTITHITSFVQKAMVDAIRGPQDSVKKMVTEFKARRDLVLKELGKVSGWTTVKPKGAFYVWPKFSQKMSAEELCTYLLEDAHVALVPGTGFGPSGKDHVRISYAASRDVLTDAISRIRTSLEKRERKPVAAKAK
jgi:aspartate aminotransferase